MATTVAQTRKGRLNMKPTGYSHTKNNAMAQPEKNRVLLIELVRAIKLLNFYLGYYKV